MMKFLAILSIMICLAVIVYAVYCMIKNDQDYNEKNSKLKPEYDKLKKLYDEKRKEYEEKNPITNVLLEYIIINEKELKIFHDDLCSLDFYIKERNGILPRKVNEEIYPLDEIKYYKIKGSERREQYVTGGGSSIKRAVVGGLIAGNAGAIIGSRKGIETSYEDVDDREIIVTLNSGDEIELVDLQCYELLLDYIPEKEYDNYIQNKKNKGKK